MSDDKPLVDRYVNVDGRRLAPDGRGGLAYVKPGNKELRDIPARDQLLAIVCYDAGPRGQGRLVSVVTRDWQIHVVAGRPNLAEPGRLYTNCECGPSGHTMDLAKSFAAAARLRHRPVKARRVDVAHVSA